jgi:hypothetical protein
MPAHWPDGTQPPVPAEPPTLAAPPTAPMWLPASGVPAPAQAPGVNGFAIASLILAICGGIGISLILSIVFGIMALSQIKKRGQRGKGLAIAGLSVAGVWIVVYAIVAVLVVFSPTSKNSSRDVALPGASAGVTASPSPSTSPSANASTSTGSELVALNDLRVGDCLQDIGEGKSVSTLPVVPCAAPHAAEVVGRFSLPAGTYPGTAAVDEQAGTGCADRLKAYAPAASKNPKVDLFYFSPLEEEWAKIDGRSVICMAVQSPPTTGSVKS